MHENLTIVSSRQYNFTGNFISHIKWLEMVGDANKAVDTTPQSLKALSYADIGICVDWT